MRVLAIDPGFDRIGIAVLERVKAADTLLHSECLVTNRNASFPERLREIGSAVQKHCAHFNPDVVAVEKTFFSKNRKTAIAVSEARGVVLYEAARSGIPVFEYTPPEVKLAIVGYGGGSKEQVAAMVTRLVSVRGDALFDDEYDAIAIGLAHLATHRVRRG